MYSKEYMGQDPHVVRFFLLLQVFTLAMIMLVTGENFLTLFVGWEAVGLASYLLVNFWYTMINANHGA